MYAKLLCVMISVMWCVSERTLLRALVAAHAAGVCKAVALQVLPDTEVATPAFPITSEFGLIFWIPARDFPFTLYRTIRRRHHGRRGFCYILKDTQFPSASSKSPLSKFKRKNNHSLLCYWDYFRRAHSGVWVCVCVRVKEKDSAAEPEARTFFAQKKTISNCLQEKQFFNMC